MAMLPPDPVYIFKGDMGPIFCLMFRRDGDKSFLYVGTQSGNVHVWNLKTKREVAVLESSKESCLSIHTTNTPFEIITQDKMGVTRFWREENLQWTLIKEITTDYYGFCRNILHNDTLYIPLKNALIQSVSVEMKEKTDVLNCIDRGAVNEITNFKIFTLDNEESYALVALESCDIYLLSLKSKTKLSQMRVDECPMALEFDPSTMRGACGCPTENLAVFIVNKKSMDMELKKNIVLKNPGVASLAIRPDGKLLAVGCWDGRLRLYSMKTLCLLAVLDVHSSTVQEVAFARIITDDLKRKYYLGVGSKDCKVSLWDLYN